MTRVILLLSLMLTIGSLSGQMVTIRGQASDYAGKSLIFYTYPEPVSRQAKNLAETNVQKDGNFMLTFPLDHPIEIYTDLEKFKGTLIVEPGHDYEISLPAWSSKTNDEAASPYFVPQLYWLNIRNAKLSDLNFLVRAFLTDYNKEMTLHTYDLYRKRSLDTARAIISKLEKEYPTGKHPYFDLLKSCSYGEIELAVWQDDKDKIIRKYIATKDVSLNHPAYQHLFNALCSDYLTSKSQDIRQKKMVTQALQGNFDGFVRQLTGSGFKKEAAELLAVKAFYDGYYSGKMDKKNMLNGLKESGSQCSFEALKACLPVIISHITTLQEGNKSPDLLLKNQKDVLTPLRPNGKYLYLVFFSSLSKESRAELDSLVTLDKKLNKILTIVPVLIDKNFQDAAKLWKEKKYPWELMSAVNIEQATSDFRIKAVPTFYLISPDNKLTLSPALSPSHNFESLFLKIYRESRFRKN
jgi:hypothetical protein